MRVYADQGVNQRKLRALQKQHEFDVIQAHDIEQNIVIADKVPHVATLDVSLFDSGDYFAGDDYCEVAKIIGSSNLNKEGGKDTLHLYTAYHAGCAYFITANPYDFIYNSRKDKADGKRRQLEAVLSGIKIVTLGEFESDMVKSQPATPASHG